MKILKNFNKLNINKILFIFLFGFILVYLGTQFREINNYSSPVWPATGFYIGMIFIFGYRYLWVVTISYFLAMIATNTSLGLSLMFSLGSSLEAVVGAYLLKHFETYSENKKYGHFVYENVLIGMASGLVSSLIGVLTLHNVGFVSQGELINQIATWAVGDTLGFFALTPTIIYFNSHGFKRIMTQLIKIPIDAWLVLGGIVSAVFMVPSLNSLLISIFFGLFYFSLRTKNNLTIFANSMIYFISVYLTIKGYTPFKTHSLINNLTLLQVFLFCLSAFAFTLHEVKKINALSQIKWLVLGGIILSISIFSIFYYAELRKDEERLSNIAENINDKIKERFNIYIDALNGGRSLFLANPNFNYLVWKKYVDSLDILNKYPGINGMGYIKIIKDQDLSEFKKYAKLNYDSNFNYKLVPGVETPADFSDHYIISMLEPINVNKSALGLDIASESNRKNSADLSAALNKPTITKKIILIQDNKKRPGFLLYVPIYLDSNKSRNNIGWVYAPFITENLLKNILTDQFNEVDLTITEEDYKPNDDNIIYSNRKEYSMFQPSELNSKIVVGQQTWNIKYSTTPFFISNNYFQTMASMIFSIMLLIMFIAVVTSFHDTANQANKLAEELSFKLIQSSKLSAVGEMAGGIAHEINNPMAIIVGRLEQLKFKIENNQINPEQLTESIQKVISTTERITKIIKGLKSFSRSSDNLPFQPTQLKSVVEGAFDLCREKFKSHGIQIQESQIPDVILNCREVQISQVLLNLLNNSHDAILDLPEKWISVDYRFSNNVLKILVTDSGNGIPTEVANKIMQPFFTTKEVGKGTGLGLSISKGIVEEHKGKFYIDRQCKNTRFIIELPAFQS